METQIQIFSNPQFGEIRTVKTDSGEPMFCLLDVCAILGLSSKHVNARLSKEVVSNYPLHTNGGWQNALFVKLALVYRREKI